jgi:hypothetical protein
MLRRTLVITVLVVLTLACVASPAAALELLWSQEVGQQARLATGSDGPIAAWRSAGVGVDSVQATQYRRTDQAASGPHTLVPPVAGLQDWFVAGDGAGNVTVVWKAGGAVHAKRVGLATGSTLYGPVTVCTDAAVAGARGAGSAAALTGAAGDGAGGVWVWCTVSPSASGGDTLLNHVSSGGGVAVADPGVAVDQGTVKDLAVDAVGHAVVLLGSPGRAGVALQRYDTDGTADWAAPSTPYNPLLPPPPAATQEPIAVTAGATAAIAWREGIKVRLQRFSLAGARLWLAPASVNAAGAVKLADDGTGGCYLAGPSAGGIMVHHVLAGGAQAAGSPSGLPGLGFSAPRVDAVAADRAGDLVVAHSDVHATGSPGVARMTCLGVWDTASLPTTPEYFAAAAPNGAGGSYVLGSGGPAQIYHFAAAGPSVTLRPRSALVLYGTSVTVGGYYADGATPVGGAEVQVSGVAAGGTAAGAAAVTSAQGYYEVSLTPETNARWRAVAGAAASEEHLIRVMPKVSLSLSHLRPSGTRLVEVFTGSVAPRHTGTWVRVQRAVGSTWRTVASGKLDERSRYRITWRLPDRTATYKVRAVVPEHADHTEGASLVGTLRVVVTKR